MSDSKEQEPEKLSESQEDTSLLDDEKSPENGETGPNIESIEPSQNENEGQTESEVQEDVIETEDDKTEECEAEEIEATNSEVKEAQQVDATSDENVDPNPKVSIPQPYYTFSYTRCRREFGRQCIFGDTSLTLCEIDPDDELKNRFKRAKTVRMEMQNIPQMAENEVLTDNKVMDHFGVYHKEGGWPKEIDISNEDEKSNYRQTTEQTEQYCDPLKRLCRSMEHKIAQNNAVNLFEEYFTTEHPQYGRSFKPTIESIAYFQCPVKNRKYKIIASHSAIATQGLDKMAISYTAAFAKGQMNTVKTGTSSYIWDLTRNIEPLLELKCEASLATLEYSEKDESIIAAGQSDGIIALYDSRAGGWPQVSTPNESSHRENVSALRWTMSKGNVEFFTCANDSFVMWWDIRNMSKPHESYQLDFKTAGCTTLDYTFSMPTRFLVGLSNGQIVNGNKRGTTYADRFTYAVQSFSGPVHTVERNPFSDKYSLAIGDQSIRFWSDENRETPMYQSHEYVDDLSCGAWNRNRCSGFFVGHASGTIDVWDWLYDMYSPIASINIVDARVEHLRSHPNGKLLINSYGNGDVHLMQISDFLASHKVIEKAKLIEMFDRENSREVLFLMKIREQKMLLAQKKDDAPDDEEDSKKPTVEQAIAQCQSDFNAITQNHTKRIVDTQNLNKS